MAYMNDDIDPASLVNDSDEAGDPVENEEIGESLDDEIPDENTISSGPANDEAPDGMGLK